MVMLVFTAALWVMVCMVKTELTNGRDVRLVDETVLTFSALDSSF